MRLMICTLPERGTISVDAGHYRRTFVGGDVVDVDKVLAPGYTLADALGHHLDDHFAPHGVVETSPLSPSTAADEADEE